MSGRAGDTTVNLNEWIGKMKTDASGRTVLDLEGQSLDVPEVQALLNLLRATPKLIVKNCGDLHA
jgi:hypothetical protein